MSKGPTLALAVLMLTSLTAAAPQQSAGNPGFVPGDLLYPFERFVETIEVEVAGAVGGEDMRAKAIANNADERLAEAQKLKKENELEKANELAEEYEREMNRSRKMAENSRDRNLTGRIDEVSRKNTESLKNVREKAPEAAQKGLDNAIEKSNRSEREEFTGNKDTERPEKPEDEDRSSVNPEEDVAEMEPRITAGGRKNSTNKTVQNDSDSVETTTEQNSIEGPTGNSVADNPADDEQGNDQKGDSQDKPDQPDPDEAENQVDEVQKNSAVN